MAKNLCHFQSLNRDQFQFRPEDERPWEGGRSGDQNSPSPSKCMPMGIPPPPLRKTSLETRQPWRFVAGQGVLKRTGELRSYHVLFQLSEDI